MCPLDKAADVIEAQAAEIAAKDAEIARLREELNQKTDLMENPPWTVEGTK